MLTLFEGMPTQGRAIAILFAALALISAGCEPDDPAVRKELVELRTALANARQELDENKAALSVARAKAEKADFLEASSLSSSLSGKKDELRNLLIQAFPGYQLVSLSLGQVETPFSSPAPYSAKVNFFLRTADSGNRQSGGEMGPFALTLTADREGNWMFPGAAQIAAAAGAGGQVAAANQPPGAPPAGGSSASKDDGARVIQWNQGGRQAPSQSAPRAPAGRPGNRPAADPMPGSHDTREIRFD